jgi:carboxyl-terminal processing protease
MSRSTAGTGRCPALAYAIFVSVCCGCGGGNAPKPAVDSLQTPYSSSEPKSSPGEFPVDKLLATLREESVFRKDVSWEKLEADVRAKVAKATTDEGRAKAMVDVFAQMNDVHSVLVVGGKAFSHYEVMDEPTRKKLLPMLARAQENSNKPVAKMLDGRIGYVLVPGFQVGTPEKITEAARGLHDKVTEIARQKPVGWVVDLRMNTGGNLYPMLTGLRHLLGDGVVGSSIDADGRKVQEWVLKPDGLYWRDGTGDRRFAELEMTAQPPDPNVPVAVLVGPVTISSGQGTALAFRGRPHSRMFGEPTAKGYTTVTGPRSFGPEVSMSLAVSYMADRTGTPCKSQVLPDEMVEGVDSFDAPADDKKLLAALRWLSQTGK